MLRALYRFKPGRTFAQALVGLLVGATIFDVDWRAALGGAALAGLVSLLQIWGEGGDLFADDSRVTGSKKTEERAQLEALQDSIRRLERDDAAHDVLSDEP